MKIHKGRDLLERAGWTAMEAGAASAIVVLTGATVSFTTGAKIVGIATLLAALKVLVAQRLGSTDSGDAIPGGVIENK